MQRGGKTADQQCILRCKQSKLPRSRHERGFRKQNGLGKKFIPNCRRHTNRAREFPEQFQEVDLRQVNQWRGVADDQAFASHSSRLLRSSWKSEKSSGWATPCSPSQCWNSAFSSPASLQAAAPPITPSANNAAAKRRRSSASSCGRGILADTHSRQVSA